MWRVGVVVRRYIDILIIISNFPTPLVVGVFFGSSILTSLFIFKCFFGLVYICIAHNNYSVIYSTVQYIILYSTTDIFYFYCLVYYIVQHIILWCSIELYAVLYIV